MSKTQINEFYSFKKFAPTPENPSLLSDLQDHSLYDKR